MFDNLRCCCCSESSHSPDRGRGSANSPARVRSPRDRVGSGGRHKSSTSLSDDERHRNSRCLERRRPNNTKVKNTRERQVVNPQPPKGGEGQSKLVVPVVEVCEDDSSERDNLRSSLKKSVPESKDKHTVHFSRKVKVTEVNIKAPPCTVVSEPPKGGKKTASKKTSKTKNSKETKKVSKEDLNKLEEHKKDLPVKSSKSAEMNAECSKTGNKKTKNKKVKTDKVKSKDKGKPKEEKLEPEVEPECSTSNQERSDSSRGGSSESLEMEDSGKRKRANDDAENSVQKKKAKLDEG